MKLTDRVGRLLDAGWIRWLLVAGLIALYAGWLGYVILADRPLDFYVYYMAAEATARGQSPYTITQAEWDALAADLGISNYTGPYRYPPYTAAILTLFRPLGPRGTMVVWAVANAVAMIGGAWLVGQAVGGNRWLAISLTALGLFVPPLATLLAGQVNGLLFLCLALSLWAAAKKRDGWLGVGLALGAALKVIPLALVLYLFWRRQWRAAVIAAAALLVMTALAIAVVGPGDFVLYAERSILLATPDRVKSTPANQTITAVLGRLSPNSPDLVLLASRWLALLVIGTTAAICWPAGAPSEWMALEMGFIVAALQMIPPFTWYHQLVLLLVPMIVAVKRLCEKRSRVWLGVLTALFVLTTIHGLTWHYIADLPCLTSFPFLLGLTLWVALGWAIASGKWRRAAE